jgi:hypothetical protein
LYSLAVLFDLLPSRVFSLKRLFLLKQKLEEDSEESKNKREKGNKGNIGSASIPHFWRQVSIGLVQTYS